MRRIAVHAHFYQPPREDPATGRVPAQPGAAPFHDWNERVHAESYRPNTQASIPEGDVERIVNNFDRLSFNVGPTLLSWMESADPETYGRIIEADRRSTARLGHGNGIAQAFHHTILPLSPLRDVRTQVRWGLADFRLRFGREAEGMWLPETAANDDVLSVLIDEGVAFTILAPSQARRWREPDGQWQTPPVDTRVPYRYLHPDGSSRELAIFFYDGDIAKQIAFEAAGSDASRFLDLFEARMEGDRDDLLIHAATDGETYGHHHVFTELGLAYALFVEAEKRNIEPFNYAAFLEEHRPQLEVDVVGGEGSSWSCAHGVGRWRRDCGCSTGGEPGWNQEWRGPLREALDALRDSADEVYERLGSELLSDPWAARDRYVDVVIGARGLEDLLAEQQSRPLSEEQKALAADLFKMQEHALAMYTSCGWFFNDIGGIETVQVLTYAAAVIDRMKRLQQPVPESEFVGLLDQAKSNDPEVGTGADVYLRIGLKP
jgi:alpha-amylase/alpha-mannosidase (GH57 family)